MGAASGIGAIAIVGFFAGGAAADKLPAFCEQVEAEDLAGVDPPYKEFRAAGVVWCEGMLPHPIGIPAIPIVSVKLTTTKTLGFDKPIPLAWCGGSSKVHLRIRGSNDYAFDGELTTPYTWSPVVASMAHETDWDYLDVLAHCDEKVKNQTRKVHVPVSAGTTNGAVEFAIANPEQVLFDHAVIQRLDTISPLKSIAITPTLRGRRTKIVVPADKLPAGVYAVSFSSDPTNGGRTTELVYVDTRTCP